MGYNFSLTNLCMNTIVKIYKEQNLSFLQKSSFVLCDTKKPKNSESCLDVFFESSKQGVTPYPFRMKHIGVDEYGSEGNEKEEYDLYFFPLMKDAKVYALKRSNKKVYVVEYIEHSTSISKKKSISKLRRGRSQSLSQLTQK